MRYYNPFVQWHITENCRNHCRHCYIGNSNDQMKKPQDLSFEELNKILQNLARFEKKYGTKIVNYNITGGDPFEHKDFEKLLSTLHSQRKKIKILGIPERIDPKNLSLLEKYGVDEYQVSLDGLAETHDSLRGQGSFDRTIQAIKYINENSAMTVSVMFTIHDGNYRELFPLIEFLRREKLQIVFRFDVLVFEGNAKHGFQMLDKQVINEILKEYRSIKIALRKAGEPLVLHEKMKLFNTIGKSDINSKLAKYTDAGGCECGFTNITILPNGDVYPCRRLPILVGNMLEDEFSDLFLNNITLRKLRRISSFEYCRDCDYAKVCRGCPALVYSITGDVFAKFPYCNQKKYAHPLLEEPDIEGTEENEFAYMTNTLINNFVEGGYCQNRDGVLLDIYNHVCLK